MVELPDIGKHCSFESCNQLDFLPFQCESCGNIYCLHHKVADIHNCSAHIFQERSVDSGPRAFSCSMNGCSKKELTSIFCDHCQLNFCLSHRHQQDHFCSELVEPSVRNAQTAQHVLQIQVSRSASLCKITPKSPKSVQIAAKLQLMKLKSKAEGDRGIPEPEQVFFEIFYPLSSQLPSKSMLFSKKWSVGKIIDIIAMKAGISNPNNINATQKLRLFVKKTGEIMPAHEILEDLLEKHSDIYSGISVILESVLEHQTALSDGDIYKS